jgi:O-antigen/teichoic acid export membrane protein
MGIIIRQTIKGTIFSYLGILIGFLTVNIIQPHVLTIEQVGLTGLLTSFSMMFAQFSILGFNGTARYFPYFRSEENKHHGYLFLACAVSFIGIILFAILAYIFKNEIISEKSQKSPLFEKYYWYLFPLTSFTLVFNVFDLYARMLYNITLGLILKEFTKRIFILVAILLIYFKLVSFPVFMVLWLLANIIPTVLIVIRLVKNKQLHLKPDFKFLDKDITRKLINICFFAIITGSAPLIIQNIDSYIILKKYGLGQTGIYTVAFYFAIIISLPARSLYSISYTIVAESWKTNDLKNIKSVYEKSCINQLISALFIFIIIWANIDNIFQVLPPEYAGGKYVIFFVSLGFLIDSATGINGVILGTSKYFKYDSLFNLLLVGVTVGANLLLIPIYGITGAAIASALTFLIFNLFRFVFILVVYQMQPFNYKTLLCILLGVLVYYLSFYSIPKMDNFMIDTVVRTSFITLIYVLAVYYLNLSEDITIIINKYLLKLKN